MKLIELFESQEQPSAEEAKRAADLVFQDCKTYLNKLGKNIANPNAHLYRGVSSLKKTDWFKEAVPRTNRAPKNTAIPVHNFLDQWFNEQFGFPYRSAGVFATKNKEFSATFGGTQFWIFPTDPYKLLYSPKMVDLWVTLTEKFAMMSKEAGDRWLRIQRGKTKELSNEDRRILADTLEKAKYREVKSPVAVKATSEVMIQCEKYYMVKATDRYDPTNIEKTDKGTFLYYLMQNMGIEG